MCQNDNDCTKKEHCKNNVCVPNPGDLCRTGWSGANCDTCAQDFWGPNCKACLYNCGQHGQCNDSLKGDGTCLCEPNWAGNTCNDCASDLAGTNCNIHNTCQHGTPDLGINGNGTCKTGTCQQGWAGNNCSDCASDFYGPECAPCLCGPHGKCNYGLNNDGSCTCSDGFTDDYCTTCTDSRYEGPDCTDCSDKRFTGKWCDECLDGATDSVRDKFGKIYKTICLNKQFWMAENMNLKTGTYYHTSDSHNNEYGLLYDWQSARNICPDHWYLPKIEEFQVLQKEGKISLQESTDNCDDKLCILPTGYYLNIGNGEYSGLGTIAYLWSGTEIKCSNNGQACANSMQINKLGAIETSDAIYLAQDNGFSVRCAQDSCSDSLFTGKECNECREYNKTAASNCTKCDNNKGYAPNCTKYGILKDGDNSYPTITINNTTWMAQNMRRKNGATCHAEYYNQNETENPPDIDCLNEDECVEKYGCLYTWNDAQIVCPSGWRLPTTTDLENLYLAICGSTTGGTGCADKLNEAGLWFLNTGGYGSSGYSSFGQHSHFWTSTSNINDNTYAWGMLITSSGYAGRDNYLKKSIGYSVRCIK